MYSFTCHQNKFQYNGFRFSDGRQIHVTVNVEPPMKQGQTRYHYMVLIFKVRKIFYKIIKEGLIKTNATKFRFQ